MIILEKSQQPNAKNNVVALVTLVKIKWLWIWHHNKNQIDYLIYLNINLSEQRILEKSQAHHNHSQWQKSKNSYINIILSKVCPINI